MLVLFFILVIGFILLGFGGDWLVKASVSLSLRLKIQPAVIALTIIAFGTSAPELVTSALASWKNASDIALANVVGSNIFNTLAVLGISCLIIANKITNYAKYKELTFLVFASFLVFALGYNGVYSRPEGLLLLTLLGLFWYYSIKRARREGLSKEQKEEMHSLNSLSHELFFLLTGIACLTGGTYLALNSAMEIGQQLGISQRVLGITVLSVGTGLPELVTSVVAARKGYTDISIGNIIGSNIINLLGVLGTTVLISPLAASSKIIFGDCFWMIGSVLIIFLLITKKNTISRWGGSILTLGYLLYMGFLLLYR